MPADNIPSGDIVRIKRETHIFSAWLIKAVDKCKSSWQQLSLVPSPVSSLFHPCFISFPLHLITLGLRSSCLDFFCMSACSQFIYLFTSTFLEDLPCSKPLTRPQELSQELGNKDRVWWERWTFQANLGSSDQWTTMVLGLIEAGWWQKREVFSQKIVIYHLGSQRINKSTQRRHGRVPAEKALRARTRGKQVPTRVLPTTRHQHLPSC